VRKRLLKDTANDTGCGLKAFKREAFLRLPYFDHIHRYIPALMLREGYDVAFQPVNHRHRETGVSKYTNFGRLKASVSDLLGVMWLQSRPAIPKAWTRPRACAGDAASPPSAKFRLRLMAAFKLRSPAGPRLPKPRPASAGGENSMFAAVPLLALPVHGLQSDRPDPGRRLPGGGRQCTA
jgi:hypothetical protein